MIIERQKVIWNGGILEVPFARGATAGHLLALLGVHGYGSALVGADPARQPEPGVNHIPEMGLFDGHGVQVEPGRLLEGGLDELILRPVYIH